MGRVVRERYIMRDGELVEVNANAPRARRPVAPAILGDLRPYRSVITGEVIEGRRAHREHLKVHGCHEVGNEEPAPVREWHYARKYGEEYRPPAVPIDRSEELIDTSDVIPEECRA
jgi:hypothetical protein